MSFPEAGIFLDKLTDLLRFLIPNYVKANTSWWWLSAAPAANAAGA